MSTAVQILQGEIRKYQEAQRVVDRLSAYPEYHGPNVEYKPIIEDLEQAVKRLQNLELTATDSQQLKEAIALLNRWMDDPDQDLLLSDTDKFIRGATGGGNKCQEVSMSDREKIDYFFANLDSLLQKGYAPAEALVKCTSDYQFVFSLQSDAQKAMEAAATSYNNKRDEICAHFKSGFECGFQQKTNCGDKACIVRKHSPVL